MNIKPNVPGKLRFAKEDLNDILTRFSLKIELSGIGRGRFVSSDPNVSASPAVRIKTDSDGMWRFEDEEWAPRRRQPVVSIMHNPNGTWCFVWEK